MAGTLTLPDEAKSDFVALASMPSEQYARLSAFVENMPKDWVLPITLDRLLKAVRPADRPVFSKTINQLARFMQTVDSLGLSHDEAVSAVIGQALESAENSSGQVLRDRLEGLLRQKAITIHVRARQLLYEEERCISWCRIVTDIRPVFNDAGNVAEAFVIINHLHIRYTMDNSSHDIYFALDEDDIKRLSSVTARARSKIESLKTALPNVSNALSETT